MKKRTLDIVGILFILLGIAGVIVNIHTKTPYHIAWFCNHTTFILGAAILLRSRFWVTAELCIALIPQTLWSLDFLSKLIFNKFIFGFTDYMFSPYYDKALYILSWNHLFILPAALATLYFMGKPVKGHYCTARLCLSHLICCLITRTLTASLNPAFSLYRPVLSTGYCGRRCSFLQW